MQNFFIIIIICLLVTQPRGLGTVGTHPHPPTNFLKFGLCHGVRIRIEGNFGVGRAAAGPLELPIMRQGAISSVLLPGTAINMILDWIS